MNQPHTPAQTPIAVGTRVQFPHRCIRWSLCDGSHTGTVTQLTAGGMNHGAGDRFAHVLAPCGALAVAYTDELAVA